MHPYRLAQAAVAIALLAACAPPATPAGSSTVSGGRDAYSVPTLPAAARIGAAEYASRRAALAASLGDGVFIAIGAPNPEHDYLPFAQDPGFNYLTGIQEPGAALIIAKTGGTVTERLFVLPRDPSREVWEGARLGADGARARTGIPTATIEALLPALDELLPSAGRIYALATPRESPNPLRLPSYHAGVIAGLAARYGVEVVGVDDELSRLRGLKSETELDLIRRAVEVTNLAHRAAMRTVEPGMNEFEVQALVEYTFRRHGADRPSFASIVGSGPNATTLHYNANDRYMDADDMLVMDIGASYRGYAADVTRTVPVDGTFSPEQRGVYEVVLAAQKAAEAQARPGATWQALNSAAVLELARGLAGLGLIEAEDATFDCGAAGAPRTCPQVALFYMHGLGHGIGLQVHDPDVSYVAAFTVGSAFTIEPGIYVRADALDHIPDTPGNRRLRAAVGEAVRRYRNIGVRIEDDYFITSDGVERISDGAPREIAEIEMQMALPGVGEADRRAAIVEWYRQTEPRD
jgi:Xaa-Pro aminopeptidase